VELLYSRCAGLDVHKKSLSACIRISDGSETRKQTATFRTFTADLDRLCRWLKEHRVNQMALESTGVFWIPVWNVLERRETIFKLTLINPQHVHALPVTELLQYGLLKGSFIPPPPIRELRDLTCRRAHLQAIGTCPQLDATFAETANGKLGSVVSDISGRTAQLILDEVVQGTLWYTRVVSTFDMGRLRKALNDQEDH
jgi:hypothetical protein